MKDRGIDALVNDCLIGPVLTMGSTFVAYICALLAYLYLEFTKPGYNDGGTFTPVVMAFSFLIGLQVCQIFMTPIGSGVDTIFVAAAWDPDVLMSDHPDFYQRMVRVYPKVQQMVNYLFDPPFPFSSYSEGRKPFSPPETCLLTLEPSLKEIH